jgi:phosphate starvation-inducible protein PhoH and related proteins
MARNSGKSHRTFPAKKSSKRPSRTEQSALRQEKEAGADLVQPQRNYTFKDIKPLNYIQGEYLDAIKSADIVFGIGSAGTGKTYIAASYAAGELFHKRVDKIILTRPNVETGRGMGFLPGELDEKYAPYLQPFDQVFTKALGKGFYEYALKSKDIDPKPLGFMRGASFENCIILVDEAQNLTKTEFKMLLSRIGKNCKVILSGDPKQTDISDSGLLDATKRLASIPGVEIVVFRDEDIVRSQMCKSVILAYNN